MDQEGNVNLKWDAHQTTLKSIFDNLLDNERLADCAVGAEGQHLKAHKVILSACSQYFDVLFSHHYGKHTVIIIPGVQFHILKALMVFIYRGEVVVPQDELDSLLQLADFLQVKGLSNGDNVVPEKKDVNKMRNKSPTSHCQVSPESYKHCDSPELLEVSGSSSQSQHLQLHDHTTVTPISMPACKRKKSDWHSSGEEPPHKQDPAPPSQTVSRKFPLRKSEVPDKSNSTRETFSDPQPRPSQLPVYNERNFIELPQSREELTSAKPLNSMVRTPVCPTMSEDNSSTFAAPKQQNCSGLNQDFVHDVIIDSDDSQSQNISDDNTFDMSVLTDEQSFSQQLQMQRPGVTDDDTSAANNRYNCPSCDKSYRYYRGLVRHLKYECGKEPQFQCPQCSARFTHKHTLKTHMFRHY